MSQLSKLARANQALKLTENAACFVAARREFTREDGKTQFTKSQIITTRAMSYDNPVALRRSLAPVR